MSISKLEQQIRSDLQAAIKNKDKVKSSILRIVVTELNNATVAKDRQDLTEANVAKVIQKLAKRSQESIKQYSEAGRDDLVKEETDQLQVLEKYLPKQLTDEELRKIIRDAITKTNASGPADMGKVMGVIMPQIQGRADGSVASQLVQDELNK